MFLIKPIRKIDIQKVICSFVGCEFIPGTLAYYAAELKEDKSEIDHYIGICQFIPGETSRILTLFPAQGCEEDEAILILCRTVMSFLARAGSKHLIIPDNAGPESVLRLTGLKKTENGYTVDLQKFYEAPCKYNKDDDNG